MHTVHDSDIPLAAHTWPSALPFKPGCLSHPSISFPQSFIALPILGVPPAPDCKAVARVVDCKKIMWQAQRSRRQSQGRPQALRRGRWAPAVQRIVSAQQQCNRKQVPVLSQQGAGWAAQEKCAAACMGKTRKVGRQGGSLYSRVGTKDGKQLVAGPGQPRPSPGGPHWAARTLERFEKGAHTERRPACDAWLGQHKRR